MSNRTRAAAHRIGVVSATEVIGMGIGVSIFLVTVGAILRFAITVDLEGVDIHMMGVILMVVGGVMFVLSLLLMRRRAEDGQQPPGTSYRHTETSDREPPAV